MHITYKKVIKRNTYLCSRSNKIKHWLGYWCQNLNPMSSGYFLKAEIWIKQEMKIQNVGSNLCFGLGTLFVWRIPRKQSSLSIHHQDISQLFIFFLHLLSCFFCLRYIGHIFKFTTRISRIIILIHTKKTIKMYAGEGVQALFLFN